MHKGKFQFMDTVQKEVDRVDGYGGIAVYKKQEILYKIINKSTQHNTVQALGVDIGSVTYYPIYIPPSTQFPVDFLHNKVYLLNKPVELLGDVNCRYPDICPNQEDGSGLILREATRLYNFQLLNDDTPTRIPHRIAWSYAINLTFTSIDIATATQWALTGETLGSDHYIAACNIRR
jgi:hypothetical protein